MPKGPRGERRPGDVIGVAVKSMKVLTGEDSDNLPDDGKDPAAVSMGKRGGKARAASLSPKKRSEIAKKAAQKRWKKR